MWKPSEIVFLLLALTACILAFLGKMDIKDFMILAIAAFSFYFGKPNDPNNLLAGK